MGSNQKSSLNVNIEHYFSNACVIGKKQEYPTMVKTNSAVVKFIKEVMTATEPKCSVIIIQLPSVMHLSMKAAGRKMH